MAYGLKFLFLLICSHLFKWSFMSVHRKVQLFWWEICHLFKSL